MEEISGLEVKRNEFSLKKVIMHPEKNLTVTFIIASTSNEETLVANGGLTYEHQTTEEFQLKLNELHPYLCAVRNIKKGKEGNILIKGLDLSGSGETENFKILGIERSDAEKRMACDTYKIHYQDSEYSWVDDVKTLTEEIEDKVFSYLFEGERAQLSLELDNSGDASEENTENQTEED